jgi:hypothetical protein
MINVFGRSAVPSTPTVLKEEEDVAGLVFPALV